MAYHLERCFHLLKLPIGGPPGPTGPAFRTDLCAPLKTERSSVALKTHVLVEGRKWVLREQVWDMEVPLRLARQLNVLSFDDLAVQCAA